MFLGNEKAGTGDSAAEARCVLASSADTTGLVLLCLSNDNCARVRQHVAGNPNAPLSLLEKLSVDPNPSVRLAAVRNRDSRKQSDAVADNEIVDPQFGSEEDNYATQDVHYTLYSDVYLPDDGPIKLHAQGSGFGRLIEARVQMAGIDSGLILPGSGNVTWLTSAKRTCLSWFKSLSKSA